MQGMARIGRRAWWLAAALAAAGAGAAGSHRRFRDEPLPDDRDLRPVRRLEYRALHPLFQYERFTINGKPGPEGSRAELWTANPAGNYAMAATAYF